jgi:hypothetical protein
LDLFGPAQTGCRKLQPVFFVWRLRVAFLARDFFSLRLLWQRIVIAVSGKGLKIAAI